jgi:hypothetical protein
LAFDDAKGTDMTMHVVYTHECGTCKAYYIPYDSDVPCPRCGAVEQERFDYIPQAVTSMQVNKTSGGTYTPGAWWVGSLGDHILSVLFGLFDRYESQQGQMPFELFIENALEGMTWGDQDYLRPHFRGIALRVREGLGVA